MTNFLGISDQEADYKNSTFAILPVPYERTVSYGKGTCLGPGAILKASTQVELYDEQLDRETYKTAGISTLAPIDFDLDQPEKESLLLIENAVHSILSDRKIPVVLGGEHSITAPVVRAIARHQKRFSVLQIDAHSDLRDSYEGNPNSHASVMRRVYEITPEIVQVGIRSQCLEERNFIVDNEINTFYVKDIRNLPDWIDRVVNSLEDQVYITLDCDGLDPSVIPSTGTPEPDGLQWRETMLLLAEVARRKKILGFDVVELSPSESVTYPDFTLARTIYRLIGFMTPR